MTELKFDPWIAHSMESIQRSGFPGLLSIASSYTLSGPLIGAWPGNQQALAGPAVVDPATDVAQLIEDLDFVNEQAGQWAAAVIDGGRILLTSDRASSYIPIGVHLPHNTELVAAVSHDDGLYWRLYGWPAAERLMAYAQHYGWADQITALYAQDLLPEYRHFAGEDPFQWIRPMLGGHHGIDLVRVIPRRGNEAYQHTKNLRAQGHISWSSPLRGSRHRLEVMNPHRYSELTQLASCSSARHRRDDLYTAAELTVTAAAVALRRGNPDPCAAGILQTVADTDPSDICERRFNALTDRRRPATDDAYAVGLPAELAREWAYTTDTAYLSTNHAVRRAARVHRNAVRSGETGSPDCPIHADEHMLARLLSNYARGELVAVALEAILLWSADPLPIADIEYCASAIAHAAPSGLEEM